MDAHRNVAKNRFGEVRSGWRIALMWSVLLVSGYLIETAFIVMYNPTHPSILLDNILTIMQELLDIGVVCFMVFFIENRRLRHFGLPSPRRYVGEMLYGIAFGAGSITVIFFALLLTGNVKMQDNLGHPHWSFNTLIWLVITILIGFAEEMINRGYTLTIIRKVSRKLWLAIVVSSILFGASHLMNPNVCTLGIINAMLFGVVASCMYIRSGSLWMPIAYHAMWDFFEGNVFGFPDSGMTTPSIFPFAHVKSNIFTGGGFGPEGGILVTCVCLVALFWVWKIYKPNPTTQPLETAQS